jgi:hypothetical protein
LKHERLALDVDISDLAQKTQNFTGSDLKNLCVAAALVCVWEEMEIQKREWRDLSTKSRRKVAISRSRNPCPRVMHLRHFEKAMLEVSASLDSSLMAQIRDFSTTFGGDKEAVKQYKLAFLESSRGIHEPWKAEAEKEEKEKKQWPQGETFAYIREEEPTRLPTSFDTAQWHFPFQSYWCSRPDRIYYMETFCLRLSAIAPDI